MISNFFEIFLLSIVQGISEFLPISSAAHLILVSNIYEFKNQSLLIDISLHLGSLLAIVFYFKKDIFDFKRNINLFNKIAVGTIPLILIGYFLYYTGIIHQLRNIKVIAWATLFFGILIYIADKNKFLKTIDSHFNIKSVLIIGFFQVLALIPGVSRSGITITAGLMLGLKGTEAARFSFLLAIPTIGVIAIAELFSLSGIVFLKNLPQIALVVLISFLTAYATIGIFLRLINKIGFTPFVIYRLLLGLLIIIFWL